ncbi:MAG: hypothetical protein U0325_21325 [Polyangiales bacterium]
MLDGRTGAVVFQDFNPSQTRTEQAIVADADGDGRADIIFGANQCAAFAGNTIPMSMAAQDSVPGLEICPSGMGAGWAPARPGTSTATTSTTSVTSAAPAPRAAVVARAQHLPAEQRPRPHRSPRLTSRARATAVTCRGGAVELCVNVTNRGDARVGPLSVLDDQAAAGVRPYEREHGPQPRPHADRAGVRDPHRHAAARAGLLRVDDAAGARECDEQNNVGMLTVDCGPM